MAENYWKTLSARTLLDHPRVTVTEHEVELPDGSRTEYLQYENLQDYVTVIAERAGEIAMIKEYSYPHDEWLWQFPEGSIEAGEEPEPTAHRELGEEAGLAAERMELIGTNYSHHRRSKEENYIFVASEVTEIDKLVGDHEEMGIEVHWFAVDEVRKMVLKGDIVQKNALAALALYLMHDGSSGR
jgi:ADP-ribose pyrophosphatase